MTQQRSTMTERETLETVRRAFGIKDAKGREFGARYAIIRRVFEAAPDSATACWLRAPGTYFVMAPHAERDGSSYGACQRDQYFDTEAEARAAGEAYLIRAEKAAMKNKARAA